MTSNRVEGARQEMARRELARRQLIPFAWYTFRQYQAEAVHKLLAWHLEQVELYVRSGGVQGIGRLMVFMPPRHGKSELVSVRFPAWFMGRNPDLRVMLASCTGSLAMTFSRQVRSIVVDDPFQAVFGLKSGIREPVALSQESRAVDAWELEGRRGGLVAAGVGGSLIGRGANLGIIDDPFKNRNEAQSQSTRDRVDDWYRSTFYTRLEKGGAVVLMHQRWHEDDLAGRLLKRMVDESPDADADIADQWVVLSLPAIAEPWAGRVSRADQLRAMKEGWYKGDDELGRAPGEPLWAGKYGREALARIKTAVGGYEWDALYQQRPRNLEGALIKAHDIQVIGEHQLPETLETARYWDLAVSGREGADYIVGGKVARHRDGRLFILDVKRIAGPWAAARGQMVKVMNRDNGVTQGIEISGQQGGYYQEMARDPKLAGVAVTPVNPQKVGNKQVRANVWASRIEDGLVFMLRAPWNDDFVSEALAFPRGAHDDQVDAVSGAVQMLTRRNVEARSYQG